MNNTPTYFGNKALLNVQKVGFLASRKISTLSVLPALDWAMQVSKQRDIAIVSGIEQKIFMSNGAFVPLTDGAQRVETPPPRTMRHHHCSRSRNVS